MIAMMTHTGQFKAEITVLYATAYARRLAFVHFVLGSTWCSLLYKFHPANTILGSLLIPTAIAEWYAEAVLRGCQEKEHGQHETRHDCREFEIFRESERFISTRVPLDLNM